MLMFIATCIVVLILLLFLEDTRRRFVSKFWISVMEIPGPKSYPIIGNLLELAQDAENTFKSDRRRAKLYYPIYKIWSFNRCAVCILDPEDIELVLSNTKHNTKSEIYEFLHDWLGSGLLTSNGSTWQYRRKILTPAFHFNILQEFVDIFNKETATLVKVLEGQCDKPYIDVLTPITEFTLSSIGETSLGVNLNEVKLSKNYKQAIYELGDSLSFRIVRPWLHDSRIYNLTSYKKQDRECIKVLHTFSNSIIKEQEKEFKSTDKLSYSEKKRLALLDLLLRAKYEGADLDDVAIREEVDTFMFEGHDTTSMGICYTLMALANEKSIQEEILQEIHEVLGHSDKVPTYKDLMEMKFMERCIKECLRLYPSVPFIARITGEDIKTHAGFTIPKDANIHIHIYDLHRVPEIWENPEKFDPDRFLPDNVANRHPFAYIPFSAGSRNCIGQRYAILEIKAALCGILRKFKLEPVHTPQSCRYRTDLVLRPCDGIKVKFVIRK